MIGGVVIYLVLMMGNVGIVVLGFCNYIFNLNSEFVDKGVYVGYFLIGIWMQLNLGVQDKIVDIWYDMYIKRDRVEEFIIEDKV